MLMSTLYCNNIRTIAGDWVTLSRFLRYD